MGYVKMISSVVVFVAMLSNGQGLSVVIIQ
jgi:hypothetical protein